MFHFRLAFIRQKEGVICRAGAPQSGGDGEPGNGGRQNHGLVKKEQPVLRGAGLQPLREDACGAVQGGMGGLLIEHVTKEMLRQWQHDLPGFTTGDA